MEELFEILRDLIFDENIEIGKKIPNSIRRPLAIFIIFTFLFLAIGSIVLGITIIQEDFIQSILFMILGLVFLCLSLSKFKKTFIKNK